MWFLAVLRESLAVRPLVPLLVGLVRVPGLEQDWEEEALRVEGERE